MVVELAVYTARVELGRIADTEIEVEIGREALPLDVIVAIVDLFGKDQAVVVAPSVRLDIIGLELALIIGDAARHAEAVRPALREVDAALGGQLFRLVVVASLDLRGQQVLAGPG